MRSNGDRDQSPSLKPNAAIGGERREYSRRGELSPQKHRVAEPQKSQPRIVRMNTDSECKPGLMKSIEDFLEPSKIGDTGSVARFRERSSGQPQRGESQ